MTASIYITALVPGGANGCAFQYILFHLIVRTLISVAQFLISLHTTLSVMVACVVKYCQCWSGQWLSVDTSPGIKWFLYVCMALSAAFTL